MTMLSALLLLQAAAVPLAPTQPLRCPSLALGSAVLQARDMDSWRGPTLDLRITLTDAEAKALGREGVVMLGERRYFAGQGLLEFPPGYFADPPEVVAARPERPVLVLSFEPEALNALVAGVSLRFADDRDGRLERQLSAVDSEPLQACLAEFARLPRGDYPLEQRHSWTFVPLPADHEVQMRDDGNTSDFYPLSALQENRSGDTIIRMTIASSGRVTSCALDVSSGHADLDAAACRFARAMRFLPQTDAAGSAVEVSKRQHIRWRVAD